MYQTILVKFEDLLLDKENPRFVTNKDRKLTNKEIMEYLIQYENVIDLAYSIKEYGGLVPGERLLVIKSKDKFIVLEGNRRTAAISLLLNPEKAFNKLSMSPYNTKKVKELFNNVPSSLIEKLTEFYVDIIPTRDKAIYSLTERHIAGIKKWSQISKMYFYRKHFDSGKSLGNLERFTGESSRSIADTLRKYSFLRFVLESYRNKYPNGTYATEIETVIPTELIIQRVFNSIKDRFNFQFDEKYNMVLTEYNKQQLHMLKEILASIAHLYWDLEEINTRNLNKVEDFNNVFFNETHAESTKQSIQIGELIIKLEESLKTVKVTEQEKIEDVYNENKDTKNDYKDRDKNENKDESKKYRNNKNKTKKHEYQLILEVQSTKKRIKIFNDFDLMNLVNKATDSNHEDLTSRVSFSTIQSDLINGSIFSGDAKQGVYPIQVKLEHNGKSVSKSITLEVYIPTKRIKTPKPNNSLFTLVTALSLDKEIKIDINHTVNELIEELQSLKNPENYKLMIASSVRQLIELSVTKIIAEKNLKNNGNVKNNLIYLLEKFTTDSTLLKEVCDGDNKIRYRPTKNLLNTINPSSLYDYLNLITHDSKQSIYTELVEKINKEITPLLLIFHNYLRLP